jgi:DNA polymerase I-like protein with 3'-5' exonuclease and polymerase domains
VIDCEATTKAKGNPFTTDNRLCLVGIYDASLYRSFDIEYSGLPYAASLSEIKAAIEEADLLIGFNIKYDLHWIRRYVPDIHFPAVWDCQLAEFILGSQKLSYPSLDEACNRRGLGSKLDVVSSEYWANGIDTDKVPKHILEEYLKQDVDLTYKLYLKQRELLGASPLFKLQCYDLLTLQEMEFNGMIYDEEESERKAKELDVELGQLDQTLNSLCPVTNINWASNDHLSVVLYGGILGVAGDVPTRRVLKDGTVKEGTKKGVIYTELPQLVKPLKNSETLPTSKMDDYELNKTNETRRLEGKKLFTRIYSVDEQTLKSVKATGTARKIINSILRRSELEKLQSTYYRGLPKTIRDKGWPPGEIHGQFNQCVARTGRLSSSGPNLQNQSEDVKPLFKSRYA